VKQNTFLDRVFERCDELEAAPTQGVNHLAEDAELAPNAAERH
jgi:hypothetical protein